MHTMDYYSTKRNYCYIDEPPKQRVTHWGDETILNWDCEDIYISIRLLKIELCIYND